MDSQFKSIVGWEKFAGQWLLRMKLAEPALKKVWPGPPSLSEPQGEVRLLAEQVLTISDVTRAVTDSLYRADLKYSEQDLALLWRALGDYPDARRGNKKGSYQPQGPVP